MKVREIKEVFGHECVCQHARAWLGERQTRVQEVPDPQRPLEALELVAKIP